MRPLVFSQFGTVFLLQRPRSGFVRLFRVRAESLPSFANALGDIGEG